MKIDLILPLTVEYDKETEIFLKYFFKSINTNLSWINNCYIIIPDNFNVPKLSEQKNVTIIKHSSFIPKDELQKEDRAIDVFYSYNIKELAEHFIIAQPEFFILEPLSAEDFFTSDNKPIISVAPISAKFESSNNKKLYEYIVDSNITTSYIERPMHTFIPCTKTICKQFCDEYLDAKIDFQTDKNFILSYKALCYYSIAKNLGIKTFIGLNEGKFECEDSWAGIIKFDLLHNKKRKIICIRKLLDLFSTLHSTAKQWIIEGLYYRLYSN